MLTADELEWMRETAGEALPSTCIVMGTAWVSDGMGGGTVTWNAVGTVACRLEAQSGDERVSGDRKTVFARYRLTMPYDTEVTEQDKVQVDGVTYRVLFVDTGKSWPVVKRLDVERVE